MANISPLTRNALALAICAALASGVAFAEKPDGEKGHKGGHKADKERHGVATRVEHFDDRRRSNVHDYYESQYKSGRCPPGLAKKHNGCLPPGQARKWQMGRPLPRDVVFYEVPAPLVIQIGQPPSGYRYVRVASDILMIAIGTKIVVDAIQDLGR